MPPSHERLIASFLSYATLCNNLRHRLLAAASAENGHRKRSGDGRCATRLYRFEMGAGRKGWADRPLEAEKAETLISAYYLGPHHEARSCRMAKAADNPVPDQTLMRPGGMRAPGPLRCARLRLSRRNRAQLHGIIKEWSRRASSRSDRFCRSPVKAWMVG